MWLRADVGGSGGRVPNLSDSKEAHMPDIGEGTIREAATAMDIALLKLAEASACGDEQDRGHR
jgi:hypothetical protein